MADPAPASEAFEVALLGPVEARRAGVPVALKGAKLRALLALLAVRANSVVAADRLIDALWPDGDAGDPARLANLLQVNVRNLRRAIEADPAAPVRVLTQQPGYRLVLGADELDVDAFEHHLADARLARRSGDVETATLAYERAHAQWRGPALDDLAVHEWARADAVRLDELRLAAVEELFDLRLARGEHGPLVPELEALVHDHPLREHLRAQLLLALYRSGRQADALRAYQDARDTLLDELGVDPGPELRELETAILQQHDALLLPSAHVPVAEGSARTPLDPPTSAIAPRPLPQPTSAIVDRVDELARVAALLDDTSRRLVTISGPGGVGKSRLALEAAHRAADAGRVTVFCELGELSDPTLVVPAIAIALGIEERSHEEIAGTIARAVGPARHLVVVDNLEHLMTARAALADLLTATSLQLLVTSRTALGLSAEADVALAPLATGTAEAPGPAVALLRERAGAVNAAFTSANNGALIALCDRMDGLPLAIELAAPLARLFDADELVARWDDLAPTAPDDVRPERHRTIDAATAWGLSLLDADARDAAMALSVFRGSFTADDATGVIERRIATPDDARDALAALAVLAEHSLLLSESSEEGLRRFRFLTSTRRALETARATQWDEADDRALRARHAARIAERLERGEPCDDGDTRAALEAALALADIELAARLVAVRITPWIRAQAFSEASTLVARALDLASGTPPPPLDAAAGSLAEAREDFLGARLHLERAYKGYDAADQHREAIEVLMELAGVAMLQGETERVDELLDAARTAAPGIADITRFVDYVEAWLAEERGELDRAREGFEAHLDVARLIGRSDEVAYGLVTLAELEALAGDAARAGALLAEADAATGPGESAQLDCYRARLRGQLALAANAPHDAQNSYIDALTCAIELGRACELSWCLDGIAACAASCAHDEDAAILFGAAAALRERAGAANPRSEESAYGAFREPVAERLGSARAARLTALAARLPVDDVIARARRALDDL